MEDVNNAVVGNKREHGEAFPNGSGTQHEEPESKKPKNALAEAQKLFAKPAAATHKVDPLSLLDDVLGSPHGSSSAAGPANGRRVSASLYAKIDSRFVGFKVIITELPRYVACKQRTGGYVKFRGMVSARSGEEIQVGDNIAHVSRTNPNIIELCEYKKVKQTKKRKGGAAAAAPAGANGAAGGAAGANEEKNVYVPAGNGKFFKIAVGQVVEFSKFYSSAPDFSAADYAFQPFGVAHIAGIKCTEESYEGRANMGASFNDIKLVAGPSTGTPCLVDEVYKHIPQGAVYYEVLPSAPPDRDSGGEAVPTPPAAPAVAEGEGAPAAAAVDVPMPAAPAVIVGEQGQMVDTSIFGTPVTKEEAVANPAAALGADGLPIPADGAAVAAGSSRAFYGWRDNLPGEVKAAQVNHIIFPEKHVPDLDAKRSITYHSIEYDPTSVLKTFKLKDDADNAYDKTLPAFDLIILGRQWDEDKGTTPSSLQRFALRISSEPYVANTIFATGSNVAWSQVAPKHLAVHPHTRIAMNCYGELTDNWSFQGDSAFAAKTREENGCEIILSYKCTDALSDLASHLGMHGWPVSRKCAMALMKKRFRAAANNFCPWSALSDEMKEEAKMAENYLRRYQPTDITNMLETQTKIKIIDEEKLDEMIYVVLPPEPLTKELREQIGAAEGTITIEELYNFVPEPFDGSKRDPKTPAPPPIAEQLYDRVFENFESDLCALTGLPNCENQAQSFLLYSIPYTTFVHSRHKMLCREYEYDQAMKKLEDKRVAARAAAAKAAADSLRAQAQAIIQEGVEILKGNPAYLERKTTPVLEEEEAEGGSGSESSGSQESDASNE